MPEHTKAESEDVQSPDRISFQALVRIGFGYFCDDTTVDGESFNILVLTLSYSK